VRSRNPDPGARSIASFIGREHASVAGMIVAWTRASPIAPIDIAVRRRLRRVVAVSEIHCGAVSAADRIKMLERSHH
jgi:hypothetical protein